MSFKKKKLQEFKSFYPLANPKLIFFFGLLIVNKQQTSNLCCWHYWEELAKGTIMTRQVKYSQEDCHTVDFIETWLMYGKLT